MASKKAWMDILTEGAADGRDEDLLDGSRDGDDGNMPGLQGRKQQG
jgi:hypothetical protein